MPMSRGSLLQDSEKKQLIIGEAKAMQYLSSGLVYVQDERYAAGAWMRRSGLFQFCTAHLMTQCAKLTQMAPHIHVLYRDIPPHPSASPARA